MRKLPIFTSEKIESYLRVLLSRGLELEADIFFVDLFLEETKFSGYETLSQRVKHYLRNYPEKRKYALPIMESLLQFLVESNIVGKEQYRAERRRILKILKNR